MCRSQAEGGQRCYTHTRTRLALREAAYAGSGLSRDLQALVQAHVEHASTNRGRQSATMARDNGDDGPGGLPNSYWQQIIDQGEALQQRNTMMAQIARDNRRAPTTTPAEATGSLEEFRNTYPDMPDWVTDSARLEEFLAQQYNQVSAAEAQAQYANAAMFSAAGLFERLNRTVPDPEATFESGVARTEHERIAWRMRLMREDDRWAEENRVNAEKAEQGRAALTAFGRPQPSERNTLDAVSRDQVGYVGTIIKRNGERSGYARLVTEVRPDGTARVLVLKGTRLDAGAPWAARLDDQTAYAARYETYALDRIVPANPEHQIQFSGTRPVADDRVEDHVYLASANERARVDFDAWRLARAARECRPFPDVTAS